MKKRTKSKAIITTSLAMAILMFSSTFVNTSTSFTINNVITVSAAETTTYTANKGVVSYKNSHKPIYCRSFAKERVQNPLIKIKLDGKTIPFMSIYDKSQYVVTFGGCMFLRADAIAEMVGGTYKFDEANQIMCIKKGSKTVESWRGAKVIINNNKKAFNIQYRDDICIFPDYDYNGNANQSKYGGKYNYKQFDDMLLFPLELTLRELGYYTKWDGAACTLHISSTKELDAKVKLSTDNFKDGNEVKKLAEGTDYWSYKIFYNHDSKKYPYLTKYSKYIKYNPYTSDSEKLRYTPEVGMSNQMAKLLNQKASKPNKSNDPLGLYTGMDVLITDSGTYNEFGKATTKFVFYKNYVHNPKLSTLNALVYEDELAPYPFWSPGDPIPYGFFYTGEYQFIEDSEGYEPGGEGSGMRNREGAYRYKSVTSVYDWIRFEEERKVREEKDRKFEEGIGKLFPA